MGSSVNSGLSPHLRGNRRRRPRGGIRRGSIPAPAGKPSASGAARAGTRVYPRTCGETGWSTNAREARSGLSPHLRGNLFPRVVFGEALGSIPAPAGKPPPETESQDIAGVYPRTCGETLIEDLIAEIGWGLSPHLRGNPDRGPDRGDRLGSIPAPAGKPGARRSRFGPPGVYPRTCGETLIEDLIAEIGWGLSPHLRGNRARPGRQVAARRSIPAPAGKPSPARPPSGCAKVYPRTCGET